MTKKDYERAATIAQAAETNYGRKIRVAVEDAFVFLFHANGNPRFDEDRFRRACVPGANVRARRAS